MTMLLGGSVNYLVYASMIYKYEFMVLHPVWAVAAGSIFGFFVNFFMSRKLVFKE